ncbi:hypothetical protein ACHAW6_001741, partial [Cyclotella cf. meneghiniana]
HVVRQDDEDNDEHDKEFKRKGGTKYVKDFCTSNWVHEALAPKQEMKQTIDDVNASTMGEHQQQPMQGQEPKK